MIRKQEGDTDRVDKYDCADYEDYIREDLGSRVFVDFEVFMKHVLHVPDGWREKWGSAIDEVKRDKTFKEHHKKYFDLCKKTNTLEEEFYPDLVETANAVLNVVSQPKFEDIPSGKHHYYHINHPGHLRGGVMDKKGLSPDLVLLHSDLPRPDPGVDLVHWSNPLHILEVKPSGTAVCEGEGMPKLVVDGKHVMPPFRVDNN